MRDLLDLSPEIVPVKEEEIFVTALL